VVAGKLPAPCRVRAPIVAKKGRNGPGAKGRWRRDGRTDGKTTCDSVGTDSTSRRNSESLGDSGSVVLGGTGGLDGTDVDGPRTGGEGKQVV